jgi:hypothetical protein
MTGCGALPRFARGLALFGGSLLLGACGDLTAGGAGEVEIEITADTVTVAAAMSPIAGTLTVGVQIFARRGAREVELTDGVQELQLPLDGSASTVVSRKTVPAGRYTGERVVFSKVEADVEDGLEVGGEPFVGEVQVELGPGDRVEIPWATEVNVSENAISFLVLEMRAPRWLRLLNVELREVPRESFEANAPRIRHAP